MSVLERILDLIPHIPGLPISRGKLESALQPYFNAMSGTPQNPLWHAEGDVLTHTKAVCQALCGMPEYSNADSVSQTALFLASLLHDIGKIHTTVLEHGNWVSPGHAALGASVARRILWQELGLCGTREKLQLRERICALIRYHGFPLHGFDDSDGLLRIMNFAANGALMPGLTAKELCILAEADIYGRICDDASQLLDKVRLCAMLAEEAECLEAPYPFPDSFTAAAYLNGREISPAYPLYDDSWGEVILLSGLPGTGKDTWIRNTHPDMSVVSLDDIRREHGISPVESQDTVVQLAREQARKLLRKKDPFIWNATNITPMTRKKQTDLFTAYGASVRIVYLETELDTLFQRNASRQCAVPENVILRMLDKVSPPERREGTSVEWICM